MVPKRTRLYEIIIVVVSWVLNVSKYLGDLRSWTRINSNPRPSIYNSFLRNSPSSSFPLFKSRFFWYSLTRRAVVIPTLVVTSINISYKDKHPTTRTYTLVDLSHQPLDIKKEIVNRYCLINTVTFIFLLVSVTLVFRFPRHII